jgi:hypothetical protein
MRQAYAHEAVVTLADGADLRAPGGAITVALCGALEHEPPCPLAPHHTAAASGDGGTVDLRILFAAAPGRVDEVRRRIDEALDAGAFTGPDGVTSRWRLVRAGCARIVPDERAHARRLLKC